MQFRERCVMAAGTMVAMAISKTPRSPGIAASHSAPSSLPASVVQALARLQQANRPGASDSDSYGEAKAALSELLTAAKGASRSVRAAILAQTAQALTRADSEHSGGVVSDAHASQLLSLAGHASKSLLHSAGASSSHSHTEQQTANLLNDMWRTLMLGRWNLRMTQRDAKLALQIQQAAGASMSMNPIAESAEEGNETALAPRRGLERAGRQGADGSTNARSAPAVPAPPAAATAAEGALAVPRPASSSSTAVSSSASAVYMLTRRQRAAAATAPAVPALPPLATGTLKPRAPVGKFKVFTRDEQREAGVRKYPFTVLQGRNTTWLKSQALFLGSYGKVSMGRPVGEPLGQKVGIKSLRTRDDPNRDPNKPERTRRSGADVARAEIAKTIALREAIENDVPGIEAALWPDANPLHAVRTGTQPSVVFDSFEDPKSGNFFMVSTLELGSVDTLKHVTPLQGLEELTASLATQVFVELAAMPEAHLDLKLENIQYNGLGQFKIADFGLARPVDVAGSTQVRGLYGTLVAPEMVLQAGARPTPLSRKTDVHALTACVLEFAAGQVASPFHKKMVVVPPGEQHLFDKERVSDLAVAMKRAEAIGTGSLNKEQLQAMIQAKEQLRASLQSLAAPAGRPELSAAFYDEEMVGQAIAAAKRLQGALQAGKASAFSLSLATKIVSAAIRLRAPVRSPRRFDDQAMQAQAKAVQRVLVALNTPQGLELPRVGGWVDLQSFPKSGDEVVDTWFATLCRRAPDLAEALLPGLFDGRSGTPARPSAQQMALRAATLLPAEGSNGQRRLREFFARQEEVGIYHDVFDDAEMFENRLLMRS